jgi:tRNA(Ile)-lysidine synthase
VAAALDRAGVEADELTLVALSGGADSVALLHAMRRNGYRLGAAHLNHRLRGAESDCDEAFVRRLCAQLGIDLVVEQAELSDNPANLEERARVARHAFLERTAERLGARHVALGHQADDQAETIVMRLMRGAGLAGLGAMAEVGPGRLIRPLLGVWRREITAYLDALGAEFVRDGSNRSPRHLRNRLRHHLIPIIERDYARGFSRRIVELGAELQAAEDFIARAAGGELQARLDDRGMLDLRGFATIHPALAAALLRGFVASRIGTLRRLDRSHIRALMGLCLDGRPSAAIDLPGGWRAMRIYAKLAVERRPAAAAAGYAIELARRGSTAIAPAGFTFESRMVAPDAAPLPSNLYGALFDADRLAGPLVARSVMAGDRIAPLGMSGTRKVKDVFIDCKLPLARRRSYPLVTVAGEVVWIPGMVRSRHALLCSKTRKVLSLKAFLIDRADNP